MPLLRFVRFYTLFCAASAIRLVRSETFKHLRINHSELFADEKNHINGIENFGTRLYAPLQGIPGPHFHLFLKECEWRFNNANPKAQRTQLIQWAKNIYDNYLGQPQEKWAEAKP